MKKSIVTALLLGGLSISVVVMGSCSGNDSASDERLERTLFLEMNQDVVIPTSVLRVTLGGTERLEAEEARMVLAGEIGGREVSEEFYLPAERASDVGNLYVDLVVADGLWSRLAPGDEARFRGDMEVSLSASRGISARGKLEDLSWLFVREMTPELEATVPEILFANARLDVEGEGILRSEEGQTWAVIEEGVMHADRGHEIDLAGQKLPIVWTGQRTRGAILLDPAIIGVHPGELEAGFRFENEFSDGTTLAGSGGGQIDSRLESTFIASLAPESGSRGQKIDVNGRGFVLGAEGDDFGMILRFEGSLTPSDDTIPVIDLEGATALERTPHEVVNDELIRQDVWYRVVGRELVGLGAHPGMFSGRITPIVFDHHGDAVGVGWEGEFEILPTKQMVYLKYLPAFSGAVDRFGLFNVEREIRDRILEVVHRDYDGLNMEFVEHPPENFVDYTTVELGGPDPADGYAFGYDNTYNDDHPKDTGNLYIDNYLGGLNWRAGEEWNNPYGGIFVESFAFFSPTLHPEVPYASENFDRIFSPFMPELGGTRVRATEWPNGDRADDIAEAIRVFANVVANTTSHEVGHALGLAHFPEDWQAPGHVYHNRIPSNCIMDAGSDRSFEQRAELDGEGPAEFNERNRTYLEQVLPLPR